MGPRLGLALVGLVHLCLIVIVKTVVIAVTVVAVVIIVIVVTVHCSDDWENLMPVNVFSICHNSPPSQLVKAPHKLSL